MIIHMMIQKTVTKSKMFQRALYGKKEPVASDKRRKKINDNRAKNIEHYNSFLPSVTNLRWSQPPFGIFKRHYNNHQSAQEHDIASTQTITRTSQPMVAVTKEPVKHSYDGWSHTQYISLLIANGISYRDPTSHTESNNLDLLHRKLLNDQVDRVQAATSSSESDANLVEWINKEMIICENMTSKSKSSEIFPTLPEPLIDDSSRIKQLIQARKRDIPDEEKSHFNSVVRKPPTHEVVILKYKIDMTYAKISVLKPGAWLNDEVINFYMCMLQERDTQLSARADADNKASNLRRTSHYFNSFFMSKLLERDQYTYANVRRWSKAFDVFSKDKIFIPVNINNTHWTMAVVFIVKKEIHYYDSMSGSGRKYLNALQRWLKDEAKDKKGIDLDPEEWQLFDREQDVPQQANGYDCGVFSIMCADYLSDDLPVGSYHQSEMPAYRVKIGCSILRGSIPY